VATYVPLLPHPVVVCLVEGMSMSAGYVGTDLMVHPIERRTKGAGEDATGWVELISELIQSVAGGNEAPKVILCVNAVAIDGQTLTSSVVPGISEVVGRLITRQLPIEVEWANWPVLLAAYRQLDEPVPDPMLLLHVADGVSAHCMIGGTVFRGGRGLAGELGHVVVDEQGPPCGCGRNGCLEACCSGPALQKRLLASLNEGAISAIDRDAVASLSPADAMEVVWRQWQDGDEFARRFMDQVFDQLAWAVGLAINLIDPQSVVAAGYVLQGRAAWLAEIEQRVQRWVIHSAQRKVAFIESTATLVDTLQTAALYHCYGAHNGRQAGVEKRTSGITVLAERHLERLLNPTAGH
jgi:glucokinase